MPNSELKENHQRLVVRRSQPLKKEVSACLNYVEYKSKLLALAEANAMTVYSELIKWLENSNCFETLKPGYYGTWLTWSNRSTLFMIFHQVTQTKCQIHFISSQENKLGNVLSQIDIDFKLNKMEIKKYLPDAPWCLNDIDDIGNDFLQLFSDFNHVPCLNDNEVNKDSEITRARLLELASHYQYNNVSTRLQKIFLSIPKPVNGPSIFWLTFNDKKLQVKLKNAPYESYIFSEANLFKDFYPNDGFPFSMRYQRIKVYETLEDEKKLILECWATLDALVLELFKVNAGFTLSGTEVLKVFQEFLLLIQPGNILLQDQSQISIKDPTAEHKDQGVDVPLRLSKMLTGKKTWYEERLGVEALTVTDKVSAWNPRLKFTQSRLFFQQSANDLRSLQLSSLLLLVSIEDKQWLLSVIEKYFPRKSPRELIAQDIFKEIFKRENMATSQGYADLIMLQKLLDWQRVVDMQILHNEIKVPWTKTNKTLQDNSITREQDIRDRVRCMIETRFFRGVFRKPELPKVSEKRGLVTERQDVVSPVKRRR